MAGDECRRGSAGQTRSAIGGSLTYGNRRGQQAVEQGVLPLNAPSPGHMVRRAGAWGCCYAALSDAAGESSRASRCVNYSDANSSPCDDLDCGSSIGRCAVRPSIRARWPAFGWRAIWSGVAISRRGDRSRRQRPRCAWSRSRASVWSLIGGSFRRIGSRGGVEQAARTAGRLGGHNRSTAAANGRRFLRESKATPRTALNGPNRSGGKCTSSGPPTRWLHRPIAGSASPICTAAGFEVSSEVHDFLLSLFLCRLRSRAWPSGRIVRYRARR